MNAAIVETNIVRFTIEPTLLRSLKIDYFGIKEKMKEEHKILCNSGFHNDNIRLVTHRDVNRKDCEKAIVALKKVLTPPTAPIKSEAKRATKAAKKPASSSSSSSDDNK